MSAESRSVVVRLSMSASQYLQEALRVGKATDDMAARMERSTARQTGGLRGIATSAQELAREVTASAKNNAEAWNTAGKAATGYGLAITGLAALVLKTGVSYNQLQQTSRAAMTTLLGGAEQANAQMDKLDDFARTSPFAKQVFISAQQQMIGFGIATEKVLPYLDAVQQSVAAMGGSNQQIAEISYIMSQISAASKITAVDLMQLGQRGINAAELIGSQMGMTGAQVREAITAGALDAGQALDALAAGMQERFGGAADNVKTTFAGAVDRVKAAWRDLASTITAPLVGPQGGGFLVDAANEAADFLRLIESLPAPVQLAIAAVTGLSGVAALLAGGFLLAAPRIIETRAAMRTLATDMPRTAGAARATGSAVMGLGKAFGFATSLAAAFYVAAQIDSDKDPAPGLERTRAAVLDLADDIKAAPKIDEIFTRDARTFSGPLKITAQIDGLASALEAMQTSGFEKLTSWVPGATQDWDLAAESFAQFDATLASMVKEGQVEEAAAGYDLFRQAARDAGYTLREIENLVPGYLDAVVGVKNANRDAAGANEELAASQGVTADSIEAAIKQHEQMREALQESRDAARDVAQSFGADWRKALTDTSVSMSEWRASLREQTQALRDFEENAREAARKGLSEGLIAELKAAGPEGAARMAELANSSKTEIRGIVEDFEAWERQVGKTTDAFGGVGPTIKDLAEAFATLPTDVQTEIRTEGMPRTQADIEALNQTYGLTPRDIETLVALMGNVEAERDILRLAEKLRETGRIKVEPTVSTRLMASAQSAADDILTSLRLIGATNVSPTVTVRRSVVQVPQPGINPRDFTGSAEGSTVPHGGPYVDRYPYLLAPGEEVISNRNGQADRWRPFLKAINAGRLADGGTAGLARGGTAVRYTLDQQIEIVRLEKTLRDLNKQLAATGKDRIVGPERQLIELMVREAQRDRRAALRAPIREARERAREIRRDGREAVSSFGLQAGMTPVDIRQTFATFRKGLREAGVQVPKQFAHLQRQSVLLARRFETTTEKLKSNEEALEQLQERAQRISSAVGGIFDANPFGAEGGGLAAAMLQMQANLNDTRERDRLLQTVVGLVPGLSTDVIELLATQADIQTLRDLDTAAEVRAFAQLMQDMRTAQGAAGGWAAGAVTANDIAKYEATIAKLERTLDNQTARLERLEARAEARAQQQITKSAQAVQRGTQAGAKAGVAAGIIQTNKAQAAKSKGRS